MARTAYTDLILSYTIGTSTDPTATTAAAWITDLYKQCYSYGYGDMNLYSATDANINAKVSDAFNSIVKDSAQRIFEELGDYYEVGSTKKRPTITLNDHEQMRVIIAVGIPMRMSSHEDDDIEQSGDGVS